MFFLTTIIDPRYELSFFPKILKTKVKRLLKSEVKNHSCRETCKSVEVSLVLPEKPKAQLPKDVVPTNTKESEQHDLVCQEIETEIKLYLAEENLSAQKVEEVEVLS